LLFVIKQCGTASYHKFAFLAYSCGYVDPARKHQTHITLRENLSNVDQSSEKTRWFQIKMS